MNFTRRNYLIGAGCLGVAGAAALVSAKKLKASPMPLIITAAGEYEVTKDYTASNEHECGIVVAPDVSNVTILLHSRLTCPTGLPAGRQNAGILFSGNNNRCEVIGRGGHIRGFAYGISAPNSIGLRISNLSVESALMRGIKIEGDAPFVRNCLIRNVFGSTFTPNQFCMGIEVSGDRPKILNNVVEEFYGTGAEPDNGEAVGISVTDRGKGGIVMGNLVRNKRKQPKSYGFWIGGNSDVSFVHNHAESVYRGAAGSSPTMGMEGDNTFRNCDENFLDSGGDWLVSGK